MKKKKLHTGNAPIGGKVSKSRRVARRVTSQYHVIRNKIAAIDNASNITTSIKQQKKQELQVELDSIGGIEAYQQASVISTQHFNTSKWITKILRQLIHDKKIILQNNNNSITKLLEIGAINTTLKMTKGFDVRAIDINSQHPSIEECDFFTVEPRREYDVIVCSMVVNCVTESGKRGEMICRSVEQFHSNGVLFLVLPLRCITSTAVGMAEFESLLTGLGCIELIPKRCTPHLVFYVLGKVSQSSSSVMSNTIASNDEMEMSIGAEYDAISTTKLRKKKGSTVVVPSSSINTSSSSSKRSNQNINNGTTDASWEDRISQVMSVHMSKQTLDYFTQSSSSLSSSYISNNSSNSDRNSNNNQSTNADDELLMNRNAKTFSLYIPSTLRKRVDDLLLLTR